MRVSDSLIRLVLEMNEENSENETKKYKNKNELYESLIQYF